MELKPCPFCGSTDIRTDHSPGTFGEGPLQEYGAACRECSASFWYPDTNAPNADWNTRPIEDAQAAEIERLTGEVEFWKSASEAQRRKNCDECVRIAEGEMVAKLQARVAELEKFEASMRCPNCDNLRLEIGQLRRRVAELEAELNSQLGRSE